MVEFGVSIEMTFKGPLFQSGVVQQQIQQFRQGVIQELVEAGEERLAMMLRPRPAGVYLSVAEAQRGKASTGNYRRNLHTRVEAGYGLIGDGGVIYGPWLEGTSSRNETTRFKGYASFRRVAQWLQEKGRPVAEAHLARLNERLGG